MWIQSRRSIEAYFNFLIFHTVVGVGFEAVALAAVAVVGAKRKGRAAAGAFTSLNGEVCHRKLSREMS
jgi:hypothetical protein